MNLIMQDDHLKAGAWAACEETNNAHITTGIKDKTFILRNEIAPFLAITQHST